MSYCFDVMSRVFDEHIHAKIDPRIALEFSMLIQEMHSANHKLNDGINKDAGVSAQARDLEEAVNEIKREVQS